MQLQTYLKNINVSPKKLRFMLPAIKKMKPARAVEKLLYSRERSGQVLYKAIQSSISNATRALKCDADLLKFKLLTIEQGQKLKRFHAGSRGNAKPIVHRYSHIKIILESDEVIDSQVIDKKVEDRKLVESKIKTQKSKVQVKSKKLKV